MWLMVYLCRLWPRLSGGTDGGGSCHPWALCPYHSKLLRRPVFARTVARALSPHRKEEQTMSQAQSPVVGIDVSKHHLDLAQHDGARTRRYANTAEGLEALVGELHDIAPGLVVAEATGGYEVGLVGA